MGLARLTVVANAVLELVLARIEVRVLTLLVFLELLKDLLLLFVRQLLAINAFVFFLDLSHFLVVFLLLFCPDNSRWLLGKLWSRFHVILRRREVDVDVCLNAADLVVWLGLEDVNQVVTTSILDVYRAAFVKH
jgi:hypothetical protein